MDFSAAFAASALPLPRFRFRSCLNVVVLLEAISPKNVEGADPAGCFHFHQQTDGWIDRWMDGRTDALSQRDARLHLKMCYMSSSRNCLFCNV